ncbi:MAG: pantothenate kinase [Saprospirales bacterium]|nr:pantothenate kinase [Saprospirales bacterium]
MNLAIDIGNTRAKAGLFDGRELKEVYTWNEDYSGNIQAVLYNQNVRNLILSSVSEEEESLVGPSAQLENLLILSSSTPLPFKLEYKTPQTLGKDRIAAAAGAQELFPETNLLVVDAGTCITTDVVMESGVYLGGSIAPGLRMRLKAMNQFTARLPDLMPALELVPGLPGDSTANAMQQGALWGALLELEGMIAHFSGLYQNLKVVITGGDASFFVKNTKTKIFAHPNLVLFGLNKILNYNVQRKSA